MLVELRRPDGTQRARGRSDVEDLVSRLRAPGRLCALTAGRGWDGFVQTDSHRCSGARVRLPAGENSELELGAGRRPPARAAARGGPGPTAEVVQTGVGAALGGHHRRMPSNGVAIVVASVSALFTGSNMLISAATYRRGGPRVKLRANRLPLNSHMALLTGKEYYLKPVIHVHLINRSSSPLTVESVYLEPLHTWMERLARWSMVADASWGGEIRKVEFLQGGDKKEIPPFGGVRWVLVEPKSKLPELDNWWMRHSVAKHPHITVRLTNGVDVQSGKVSNWRAFSITRVTKTGAMVVRSRNRPSFTIGPAPDVQLSFDDLEE